MTVVLTGLSMLCAALPMLSLLMVVWAADRYDREPLWLVALSFGWGAIGAVLFALPLNTLFQLVVDAWIAPSLELAGVPARLSSSFIGPTIGAPLFEEPAKALFLLFVAWNRRPNDMSSGFVYGAAAGLGFGMTENFHYFVGTVDNLSNWVFSVVIRTCFSALLHAMCSSLVGAAFGFGRLRGWLTTALVTSAGLFAAMLLHALWNGLLTLNDLSSVDLQLTSFVLLPLEILFVIFIWQLCLFDDALSIRRELEHLEEAGRIPEDHSWLLASWWRRKLADLGLIGPIRDRYIRTATTLARRRRQLRLLGDRASDFYRDDVHRLDRQLDMLVAQRTLISRAGDPGTVPRQT